MTNGPGDADEGASNARDTMGGALVNPTPGETLPDSLKSFIGANTMLLAAMGAMTGLATFVGRGAGPETGRPPCCNSC